MRIVRLAAVGVAGLALLFAEGTAGADPSASDAAVAQGLFDTARDLIADGRYADACPKLEESLRLDPGLGTQYHLADCYEHVGKTASAWAAFLQVAALAKASGQPDREKVARGRARALESHVSHVVITVLPGARASDLAIRRDGDLVGAAQLDTPLPLDPGPHAVVATADGQRFEKRFDLGAEGSTVHVEVPAFGAAPVVSAPPPAPPKDDNDVTPSRPGHTQRVLGVVTAGVGVLGIGVGTFFGLRSMSKRSDANAECNDANYCTDAGIRARNDAITAGNVATVGFIAGGALLAGGIALYLTAPKGDAPANGNATSFRLHAGPLGVSASGTF